MTSATPKPRAGEHVPEGQFSGHTPGPWHWDCDPVKGDPTGRVRYRVCALGKTITQVYYSSFEGGPTSAEADARLIAFAPDLLAERDLLRERERELVSENDALRTQNKELGRNAARYEFLAEQNNDWHVERWINALRGSGIWKTIRGKALAKAIDEALAKHGR